MIKNCEQKDMDCLFFLYCIFLSLRFLGLSWNLLWTWSKPRLNAVCMSVCPCTYDLTDISLPSYHFLFNFFFILFPCCALTVSQLPEFIILFHKISCSFCFYRRQHCKRQKQRCSHPFNYQICRLANYY